MIHSFIYYLPLVIGKIKFAVCHFVCVCKFGIHFRNFWTDLVEIFHRTEACPGHCKVAASGILVTIAPGVPPGEQKMCF